MELYRIMSFFELYELLINKRLKMTKLELMDDKNEGLGLALRNLVPSSSSLGFLLNLNINKEYKKVRENTFISCWTKEKDSMAMWLLYSKDCSSIRIKINKKNLERIIDSHLEKIHYRKHFSSPENTIISISSKCKIDDVNYIEYQELLNKTDDLKKEFEEKVNLDINESDYQELINELYEKGNKIIDYDNALFLKNKAFEYEKEVRAGIQLSIKNDLETEKIKCIDNQLLLTTTTYDCMSKEPSVDYLEKLYYIDFNMNDFIEEICFDPRIKEYQKKIYIDILGLNNDKRVVSTNIFGSYIKSLD